MECPEGFTLRGRGRVSRIPVARRGVRRHELAAPVRAVRDLKVGELELERLTRPLVILAARLPRMLVLLVMPLVLRVIPVVAHQPRTQQLAVQDTHQQPADILLVGAVDTRPVEAVAGTRQAAVVDTQPEAAVVDMRRRLVTLRLKAAVTKSNRSSIS